MGQYYPPWVSERSHTMVAEIPSIQHECTRTLTDAVELQPRRLPSPAAKGDAWRHRNCKRKTRESSLTSGEVSTIISVCKRCMQVHVGWRIRTAKQHLQRVQNIAAIEVSCHQDFRGSFCELNLSTCDPLILPPLPSGARAVEATGRLLELLRKHFWR